MCTFFLKYIKKSDWSLLTQLCIYTYLTTLESKSHTTQMLAAKVDFIDCGERHLLLFLWYFSPPSSCFK